ncbi:hypothetical protein ACWEJ6_46630 [Nonomuraea sp. NPDC004702]
MFSDDVGCGMSVAGIPDDDQVVREKSWCAFSFRHDRFVPAPISIPITARKRVQATKTVVSAENTGKGGDE